MNSGLPARILIARGQFAERAYTGQLELAALPRLQTALQGDDAELQVNMRLEWDTQWRRPAMQLHVGLKLELQCQRCMQVMQWTGQVDNRLLLLESDVPAPEPEDMDIALAENGEVDTLRLIEDEILLALPLAPLHDSDTPCGRTNTVKAAEQEEADNPFAVLAALKTKH